MNVAMYVGSNRTCDKKTSSQMLHICTFKSGSTMSVELPQDGHEFMGYVLRPSSICSIAILTLAHEHHGKQHMYVYPLALSAMIQSLEGSLKN